MEAAMRIILLSLAAIGVAAAGGAAAARPGSLAMAPRGGAHAATGAPGGGFISRGHQGFGRGTARGRRHGRFGRGGGRFGYPFGYFGLGGYGPAVDPHGNGFFAGGGGEIVMAGGRPVYDYDRSYPYEWSAPGGAHASAAERRGRDGRTSAVIRCTVEHGVRVCRGGR
jgi:hypothetical protein